MNHAAILVTLMALNLNIVKTDYFRSMVEFGPLLQSHSHAIDSLQGYLREQKKNLDTLRKFLRLFKTEQRIMQEVPDYLENPINAYILLKRLTIDLDSIHKIVLKGIIGFTFKKEELKYPTRKDLHNALIGIARIQETYDLDVEELAAGIIRGNFSYGKQQFLEYTTPLSAKDCFDIGNIMFHNKALGKAVLWFKQALKQYHIRSEPLQKIIEFEIEVTTRIRDTYDEMNDTRNAFIWTQKLEKLIPDDADTKTRLIEYKKRIKEEESNKIDDGNKRKVEGNHYTDSKIYNVYKALCKGEIPEIDHSLRCHYKYGPHPFLRLARVKTELLHRALDVTLYHDVISDDEIRHLQQKVRPKLEPAQVHDVGINYVSNIRVGKDARLSDEESAVVARVSRRVIHLTNLPNREHHEPLSVVNYGIGGHYAPHFDFFDYNFQEDGTNTIYSNSPSTPKDRLATVLFYMSDVPQGGATVFIRAKVTVFPQKGAALFWWNQRHSGDNDVRTLHAGCPVLRGSKWIANKWIRGGGNQFLRLCELREDEAKNQFVDDMPTNDVVAALNYD